MSYSATDITLRKAWLEDGIATKSDKLLNFYKGGKECKCLLTLLVIMAAWTEILGDYDETEDYNCVETSDIDNITEQIENVLEIEFNF